MQSYFASVPRYEEEAETYNNYFDHGRQDVPARKVLHRLLVDSRDAQPGGTPFDFVVLLDGPLGAPRYSNVVSVELKALNFPKIEGEQYVIMEIAQLNQDQLSISDAGLNNMFAVAFFETPLTGDVKPLKGRDYYDKVLEVAPPIELERLNVKFRKHGGQTVQASDVANVSSVSFLLEITCIQGRLQ